ncbi:MAG: hypothetical protein KC561_08580, partial [Myxococcales bacterium]|nr:hypothetical protein [Myxococcales bacterium]
MRHLRLSMLASALWLAVVAMLGACADDSASTDAAYAGGSPWDDDQEPGDNSNNGNQNPTEPTGQNPPEQELDFEIQPPAAGQRFVYVANSDLDAVTRVDGETLQVDSFPVGRDPIEVLTVPGSDRALILCRGSAEVWVLDPELNPEPFPVDVAEGANRLVVSPDGAYAFAYYDVTGETEVTGDPSQATAIRVATAETSSIVAGYGIRDVQFDGAGETAFLVSLDGLSVVDLTSLHGDQFAAPIPLTASFFEQSAAESVEVLVTSNGRYAIGRIQGLSEVVLLNLESGERSVLDFGTVPTDVDLLTNGLMTAVLKETGTVAWVPIPAGF